MKTINLQLTPDKRGLYPYTPHDLEEIKEYLPNQVLKAKLNGYKHPRSPKQIRFVHKLFEIVAENSPDPKLKNDAEYVKRWAKTSIKFFEDMIVVDGVVYCPLRSLAFDKMGHKEATKVINKLANVCAEAIGISVDQIKRQAQRKMNNECR